MEQTDYILKIAEVMSKASKIAELRELFGVYSENIMRAAGSDTDAVKGRVAVLNAIRPYMNERKRYRADMVIKFIELSKIIGELRELMPISASGAAFDKGGLSDDL